MVDGHPTDWQIVSVTLRDASRRPSVRQDRGATKLVSDTNVAVLSLLQTGSVVSDELAVKAAAPDACQDVQLR